MKMNTAEKIEVMQAYLDGKKIQFKTENTTWKDYNYPAELVWDWAYSDYRIKPEEEEMPSLASRDLSDRATRLSMIGKVFESENTTLMVTSIEQSPFGFWYINGKIGEDKFNKEFKEVEK